MGKATSQSAEFFVATLENCLAGILSAANQVDGGTGGERAVHELRVAIRRTRTALRELSGFGPPTDDGWELALGRAFRELGSVRDATTIIPNILDQMQSEGIHWNQEPGSAAARVAPEQVVRDAQFLHVISALQRYCHSVPIAPHPRKGARESLQKRVAKRLEALHRRLAKDAEGFAELDGVRQHRVRKRAKRLRYLCEFSAPLYKTARVERYLAAWREAQDALGTHNDYRIGLETIGSGARASAQTARVYSWLEARVRLSARRSERSLTRAVTRRVFW